MITRAHIRRQLRKNGGIMNVVPRQGYIVGDIVKSWDEKINKTKDSKVTETFVHENVSNGLILNGFIKTTTNHPFYSDGKWIEAINLKIGDKILRSNGEESTIESSKLIASTNTVYNFEVDDTHTYIVEDYVVHNKRSRQKHRGHTRAMRNGGRIRRNR